MTARLGHSTAIAGANIYRRRWTLETMFQTLTVMLQGEVATLGYPRAALFGFGIALASYNVPVHRPRRSPGEVRNR